MYQSHVQAHIYMYSKTCLKRPPKIDKTNVLKANGSLMKVESISECSLGAFCNTFDLHLTMICLENQFLVFSRVDVLDRFYCIALLSKEGLVR